MPALNGTRPKVLLVGQIHHAHRAWKTIEEIADVVKPSASNRAEFLAEASAGAFDGIVAMYRTFESVQVSGPIDEALLDTLPRSLRFIAHNGAGYDQVNVAACTARGIRVSNTPTAVDDATADIAIFLMLGALRNLAVAMGTLRAGLWRGRELPAFGHDPQGKVLGILGMGGIGRNLARKASAFGMRVRYYNRSRLEERLEKEVEAEYVDFKTLLRESDVLSLNLPLNKHTHHIISAPEFAMMKKGVTIVNTARGAVMDEAALVDALASGHVDSVGLDVYENEPEIHPGLLSNPRVLMVPHMGTWSVETQTKMEEWTISNVRMAIEKGELRSIVPEQRSLL